MKYLEQLKELSKCQACLRPFKVEYSSANNNNKRRNSSSSTCSSSSLSSEESDHEENMMSNNNDDNDSTVTDQNNINNGSSSNSTDNNNATLRLPTKGRTCNHRICQSCIFQSHLLFHEEQIHLTHNMSFTVVRRRLNRTSPWSTRFVPCPCCQSSHSFHGKCPPVDKELIMALKDYNKSFGGINEDTYQTLHTKCCQQPWRVPLKLYPNILAQVANWESKPIAVDTIHTILKDGLLQVYDG